MDGLFGRILKASGRRVHFGVTVPTLEDKVLQRAVLMVLEPVYEQDFLPCSYGFRPGRSAHQALDVLRRELMESEGGWMIELDIRAFFDSVDWAKLRDFLDQRVRDGVVRRTIGKWLNAGVMEEGVVWHPVQGTPQGGVISPLLANIFLHEVLDVWFEQTIRPLLRGRAFLLRFADDAVLGFECEEDARRVLAVLPKRFGKYGLHLHPEKTRLVKFHRPGRHSDPDGDNGTFDLLGFTHYWGRSRKGNWVVKRKTARDRLSRALKRINRWCRSHRHDRVADQQVSLNRKLRGHYQYYGITGNAGQLASVRRFAERIWRKWLNRRSYAAGLDWVQFKRLLRHYPLAPPRVVHSV